MAEPRLDALQAWFLELVTHPEGVAAGARAGQRLLAREVEELCLPSERLAASERVGIYADMYFLRLLEVLGEDFPALSAFLGPAASERLLRAYLVRHPSRHPNLNQLGRELPGFLEHEARDVVQRAFASELARLERALQEVFDAPRAQAIATDELLAVAPDAWGALRLELAPALQLLALEHPTNAWYQAWRDTGVAGSAPAPARSWLVLYRHDWRVWRQPLCAQQHALLAALQRGATLDLALAELALQPGVELETVGRSLSEWFRAWSGLGFFVGLR